MPSLTAMKRRIRPISHQGDMSMFHWVEMNVIDVPREIRFVAQGVLPIAPLPDAALRFIGAAL
jgi:hypothetical protein